MSQVAAGQLAAARQTLLDGKRYAGGQCNLDDVLQSTEPLPQTAGPEAWDHEKSIDRQRHGLLATADALLRAGNAEGARAALDRPLMASSGELQTLARIVQAYLDGASSDPSDLSKATAFAALCDAYRGDDATFRPSLPVPAATWSLERIAELARRARRWLEGERDEATPIRPATGDAAPRAPLLV